MSAPKRLSLTEDVELAAGSAGAVVAADQIIKAMDSEDHELEHLLKAGVGAAVAVGAYEIFRRGEQGTKPDGGRNRRHSSSSSHSASRSPHPQHHSRHLFEEILGAYSLGKEMMGDKNHHVAHLVGEVLGATGLAKELRDRDKELEEKKHK